MKSMKFHVCAHDEIDQIDQIDFIRDQWDRLSPSGKDGPHCSSHAFVINGTVFHIKEKTVPIAHLTLS